jgi:hypothetical protein
MAWESEAGKRQVWRERLRRFSRSGLTVVAFCQAERVSVPSFYAWRRKFAALDAAAKAGPRPRVAATARRAAATFLPVSIASAAVVEINLPNGVRVRLPAGDLASLAAAIAAAGQTPCSARADGSLQEDAAC